MSENKAIKTAHQLNRTLKRMFRISEFGLGVCDTVENNGEVVFYWQINELQSFYLTVKADIELVEAVNIHESDIKYLTIKELVKTEISDQGVRQKTVIPNLKVADFIEALKEGLDKTNTANYNPYIDVPTKYVIAKQ